MIAAFLSLAAPAWRFLKPVSGYLLIAALAVLALWWANHAGYKAGVKHEQAAQAERVKKSQKRVLEGDKKSDAANAAIATKHVQTVEKIRWRTETLTKEIPVYVPPRVDVVYRLPVGLVSLHNAAAIGASLPEAPGGSVETASDVTASQLATAIVGNYGTCFTWQSEALTWRKWYVEQRDIYNQTIGAKP